MMYRGGMIPQEDGAHSASCEVIPWGGPRPRAQCTPAGHELIEFTANNVVTRTLSLLISSPLFSVLPSLYKARTFKVLA